MATEVHSFRNVRFTRNTRIRREVLLYYRKRYVMSETDREVKQGCTLSPSLFNIFINQMIIGRHSAGLRERSQLAATTWTHHLADCTNWRTLSHTNTIEVTSTKLTKPYAEFWQRRLKTKPILSCNTLTLSGVLYGCDTWTTTKIMG